MKKFIEIPSTNVFEEKSKAFHKSRLAERLQKKYEPKPFEETFKPVYWLSIGLSYFCNLFSILTASTFVFTYLLSILANIPYPAFFAVAFTVTGLIFIEALQRILAPHLFQSVLQYGFKTASAFLVAVILLLSGLSVYFSYNGGFDVVDRLSRKPVPPDPELVDIARIRTEYNAMITEAGNDAREYKKTKLWNGRLSDDNAKVYNDLLSKKDKLRQQLLSKVNESEANNQASKLEARAEFENAQQAFQATVQTKGGGLAKFTIIAQLLFFLSIFFTEYFDYRTASQYASTEPGATGGNAASVTNIFTSNNAQEAPPESPPKVHNQIGFKSPKALSEQEKQQDKTTISYKDKYTIAHNGKRYSMKEVKNFVNIYKKRVAEAKAKGKEDTAKRRQKTLDYWKEKENELSFKLNVTK